MSAQGSSENSPLIESTAQIYVHESAFPEAFHGSLIDGLAKRRVDSKFLYIGLRQSERWLRLHEAHSPARLQCDVLGIYQAAFEKVAELCKANVVHLVGMAPGGGQKETACLQTLRTAGKALFFSPCDASLEIVLSAHDAACRSNPGLQSYPILADLPHCNTFPAILKAIDPGASTRLVTFFGTLHNFLPSEILPKLLYAVRSQDFFLVSANLAPVDDYEGSLKKILQQYDNELTREWLHGALEEIGIDRSSGELVIRLGADASLPGLKRIEAAHVFSQEYSLTLRGREIQFSAGEELNLFFSFRYSVPALTQVLKDYELDLLERWTSSSQEEGVFLCRRKPAR